MVARVMKRGYILKVISNTSVVINLGRQHGVRNGMKFIIYEDGGMVSDPKTKKPIEQLEIVKGTVEITNLQEKISTAETLKGESQVVYPMRDPLGQTMRVRERLRIAPSETINISPVKAGDLVRQVL